MYDTQEGLHMTVVWREEMILCHHSLWWGASLHTACKLSQWEAEPHIHFLVFICHETANDTVDQPSDIEYLQTGRRSVFWDSYVYFWGVQHRFCVLYFGAGGCLFLGFCLVFFPPSPFSCSAVWRRAFFGCVGVFNPPCEIVPSWLNRRNASMGMLWFWCNAKSFSPHHKI